ncbi:hypothetical protein EPN29_00300 [bacterium]|nr:MAG: hypothetical protein EPN29_00300 [bacterium]
MPTPAEGAGTVRGARFRAGGCRGAQGHGVVCVTGIECPMTFSLRFNVIEAAALRRHAVGSAISGIAGRPDLRAAFQLPLGGSA